MADNDAPHIYACIAAVSAEIAQEGISKSRKNTQQNYRFRGIDDVYNALAPIVSKHGLVIVPRILSRAVTERETKSGGVLFYVVVEAEFDFISAKDGSKVTARTYGEAMDSADKATNKAMSAAYKYVAFQTFCIPTEGDNDADAGHHEVKRQATSKAAQSKPVEAPPDGYTAWLAALEGVAHEGPEALREAWQSSSVTLRAYITKHDMPAWEALKERAAAVKVSA